ncbi:MAG: hypothetical protein GXO69_00975 [Acidobacteria bacterium]|nr:hypothetical protein [Acidobacteriota bacterium]
MFKNTRGIVLFILLFFSLSSMAGAGENCFSVLAGNGATRDGAVYFAHNEDDPPPQIVNFIKVPHLSHKPGEVVTLKNGGTVPQVPETAAYIWLQMPGEEFADSYMNEYGVAISSNQCQSRVKQAKLTDGGIGYWLRRLMAERAHTAREAVEIGGKLVEEFGYHSSGRTYSIADTKEAWLFSVVRGRLWVAERVPDNQVAVIANCYTIGEIKLSDNADYLGTPAIISYAVKRGWYKPDRDGAFNFREIYNAPKSKYSIRNLARWWRGVVKLSGKDWSLRKPLPFSFVPARKLGIPDLTAILRDHYEGCQFETPADFNHGNPHGNFVKRICSDTTQYGFVAQLRPELPVSMGAILWIAPRRPCIQPFVPVYCGILAFPHGFARKPFDGAIASQFTPDSSRYVATEKLAYWSFFEQAMRIDADYGNKIEAVRLRRDEVETTLMRAVPGFEKKVLKLLKRNQKKARTALTRFSAIGLKELWKLNR